MVATTLVWNQATHLELWVCNITDESIQLPAGKVIASGSEATEIDTDNSDNNQSNNFLPGLPEALDKFITAADLSRPDH